MSCQECRGPRPVSASIRASALVQTTYSAGFSGLGVAHLSAASRTANSVELQPLRSGTALTVATSKRKSSAPRRWDLGVLTGHPVDVLERAWNGRAGNFV